MFSYAAVVQALKDAVAHDARLRQGVCLYIDLLQLQSRVNAVASKSELSATMISACVEAGQPVLAAGDWTVDSRSLAPLCVQVAHRTAQHRPDLGRALARISAWFVEQRQGLERCVFDYLRGVDCEEALAQGLHAGLYRFVLAHGLHPFLRAEVNVLESRIDVRRWFRGTCPVCGGQADMAALERGGERRLLCSQCDMEWPFFRTACPSCADETNIAYYVSKPGYRLYVCESCKHYMKTVDLREVEEQRVLPAERILTAGLDEAARAAGWGNQKLEAKG